MIITGNLQGVNVCVMAKYKEWTINNEIIKTKVCADVSGKPKWDKSTNAKQRCSAFVLIMDCNSHVLRTHITLHLFLPHNTDETTSSFNSHFVFCFFYLLLSSVAVHLTSQGHHTILLYYNIIIVQYCKIWCDIRTFLATYLRSGA